MSDGAEIEAPRGVRRALTVHVFELAEGRWQASAAVRGKALTRLGASAEEASRALFEAAGLSSAAA